MKPSPFLLFLALFIAPTLCGCSHDKTEAGALLHAMEQYRAAPDETKMQRATDVASTPCSTKEICDVKLQCLQWAEPTAKGLSLKIQAQKTLADIKADKVAPNDPSVSGLPDQLDEASRLLEEGHGALEPCEEKLTELRIKYNL